MPRVIQDQLSDHLLRKDLINPLQHRFISTKSCSTYMIDFFNEATHMCDHKQLVVVLFDIKKAFDKVPPNQQTNPLSEWIKPLLMNRYQVTKISSTSTLRPISSEVVKGSVLAHCVLPPTSIIHGIASAQVLAEYEFD